MTDTPAIDAGTEVDDGRLYCYRHPKSATWVRCGNCDRPICPRCAVQGPVGFRCRDCGLMKNDPLATFKPTQLALAIAIAFGGGTIAGIVANQIGFFSIVVGYFAGGLIVEAEQRVIGIKRGPVMLGIVLAGILAGAALGFAYQYATFLGALPANDPELQLGALLQQQALYALISAGAACVGAYSRLR
jgi:hypothetical protein